MVASDSKVFDETGNAITEDKTVKRATNKSTTRTMMRRSRMENGRKKVQWRDNVIRVVSQTASQARDGRRGDS